MSSFNYKMPHFNYPDRIIEKFYNSPTASLIDYNKEIYLRNSLGATILSLNHPEVIEYFIKLLKPKNFAELGVFFGETTKNIIDLIPQEYYGIDIYRDENIDFFLTHKPNFKFFHMSTDQFFQQLDQENKLLGLDMAFIDACHSHEASYRDFLNIRKHMNEDGFILFHDTYPESDKWTTPERTNNCYLTAEVIRKSHYNEFEILTLPINPGLSIARKCTKQLRWLAT